MNYELGEAMTMEEIEEKEAEEKRASLVSHAATPMMMLVIVYITTFILMVSQRVASDFRPRSFIIAL